MGELEWKKLTQEALECPWTTSDVPAIPGVIKSTPEDFVVEEIPAYQPCGEGEHLFLWIEKRNLAAEDLLHLVARALRIPVSAIGCAGFKDKVALTRQYLSVPRSAEYQLKALDQIPGLRVLEVRPHVHKLRASHLKGNRFQVLVRGTPPGASQTALAVLQRLQKLGLPNFYGRQRFGHEGATALLGFGLLAGQVPRTVPAWRGRLLRKFHLSAAQSALFNVYLKVRMRAGLLRIVLQGDVMQKVTGGLYVVQDRLQEQKRFEARAAVPAGPIFGRKMFRARGDAAALERKVLKDWNVDEAWFTGYGRLLLGTRRPNLVFAEDTSVEQTPDGLRLGFTLPPGSYATVLLEELLKRPLA
jgi:tRNA pseudouridine13 synthase